MLLVFGILLLIGSRNPGVRQFESVGFSFFSTFQSGIADLTVSFSEAFSYLGDYKKLKTELEDTKNKLELFYTLTNELSELKRQNRILRGLLGFSYMIPSLYGDDVRQIPAVIIAKQPGNHALSFVVNRGEKDGVKVDMPVVAWYSKHQGLVGKVVDTGINTAVVMPLFNDSFHIAASFESSGYEGLVKGMGDNTPHVLLQYLEKQAKSEIKYGDLLVSSGVGRLFPKGIHIGKVKVITSKPYETSMECELEPVVDFSRLREVFILDTDG
ncbi:MAG: rod shape-determining protein MreC [Spirochaetales bacterium]|nr:rod shape-determining protein MreC [Spirochaetales bacterium]